jgi:hypothetical protein
MIFGSNVRNRNGAILIAHGQAVTDGLLQRLRNLPDRTSIVEPLLVIEPVRSNATLAPTR